MERISDVMIMRAVELWCRKLYAPVFDNGDNSEQGGLGHMLATINIQADKSKIDDLKKSVKTFKEELTKELFRLRDSDDYFPRWIDVDYHPCKVLAEAADKAGIPHSQFSCKSSVSIFDDRVSSSFGYGAESINHYPLPNGNWLLTTLCGSDIDKVIEQVMSGNSMGLTVEKEE